MRNVVEALNLPSVNQLKIGALALGAAFSIHAGRLSDIPYHAGHQAVPELLGADFASAADTTMPMPQPTPESGQPGQQQEDQLEQGVPTIIQDYINSNTVVINALRCSGALIRNAQGVPVGALTAAHCIDSPDADKLNPLVKGGDGNTYIVSATPITLETGIDSTNLQTVGTVQEFVIPPRGIGIDQALALLPGSTPQEVISDYQQEELSKQERVQLKQNKTTIWVAGYPYTQNGDSAGNMILQELPTTYIGEDIIPAASGAGLEPVMAATAKTDTNGAFCSWGLSGGEGLVTQVIRLANGVKQQVVRSVGNFSIFAPFKGLKEKGGSMKSISEADALSNIPYYDATFPKANFKGVNAVCSYAYKSIGSAYQIVYTAPSLSAVPAPVKQLK